LVLDILGRPRRGFFGIAAVEKAYNGKKEDSMEKKSWQVKKAFKQTSEWLPTTKHFDLIKPSSGLLSKVPLTTPVGGGNTFFTQC